MSRYLDSIAQPWSREEITKAIFSNFTEAREAIEDTEGGRLWKSLSDLQDSLWIFQRATTDLLDQISLFADRSRNSSFWYGGANDAAATHTREVKRCIFNATSSLMALVDNARNFQDMYPVDGYDLQRSRSFNVPGLHSFLQCFRNYNTHWRVAEANWTISSDFKTGERSALFVVAKAELNRWGGWNSSAKEYIAMAPASIDVHSTFFEYRRMVQEFYLWHQGAVFDQYARVIQPYLEHKRIYEGTQRRYHWGMLLSVVSNTVNPYTYLAQYLSGSQVETLLALEHRSEAQVDMLIEMMGMGDFCTPDLRGKVLKLFRPGAEQSDA